MSKPDCCKCKHRRSVPGSCHSACAHPGNKTGMLDMFNPANINQARKLNIKGHPDGIRNGWFMWPVNFDPTWLLNCDGFEAKESEELDIVDVDFEEQPSSEQPKKQTAKQEPEIPLPDEPPF